MTKIKLISLARDRVGNTATIRAEILGNAGAYFRVKDTIEIEIEGIGTCASPVIDEDIGSNRTAAE